MGEPKIGEIHSLDEFGWDTRIRVSGEPEKGADVEDGLDGLGEIELLPCPFCGCGEPYVCEPSFRGDDFQIGCYCGQDEEKAVGSVWRDGKTFEEAAERWNTRVPHTAAAPLEGWRPISEIPDRWSVGLVAFDNDSTVTIAQFSSINGWFDPSWGDFDKQPTHWMPLPKPPSLPTAALPEAEGGK